MRKYERGKKDLVYMTHKNGPRKLNLCFLSRKEAKLVKKRIELIDKDLEKIVESARPYVLFSGGEDSLCTLLYVNAIAQKVHRSIKAIHVDTTVGITETNEYVRDICRKIGVDLQIVKPKIDFFTLANKWGIPSHGFRWCCRELKIKPIAEYLRKESQPKVVLDGIRAIESAIRASYLPVWHHPSFRCICVSPIFHWSDKDVYDFIDKFTLPKKFRNLHTSPECWCGAYKSKSDFERLYQASPELFDKLANLEMNSKTNFTFIYENGRKISLIDLKSEIVAKSTDMTTNVRQ